MHYKHSTTQHINTVHNTVRTKNTAQQAYNTVLTINKVQQAYNTARASTSLTTFQGQVKVF